MLTTAASVEKASLIPQVDQCKDVLQSTTKHSPGNLNTKKLEVLANEAPANDLKSKYLDVADVCQLLKISKNTLYKWRCETDMPCIKVRGKLLFIPDELCAWVEKHQSIRVIR